MDEPLRLPRASAGRVDRRVDPRMRRWCDIIARLTAAGFAVTASLLVAGCVDGPPPFMVLNTDPVVPGARRGRRAVPSEGDLHGEWDAWMGEIDRPIVENPIEGDLSGWKQGDEDEPSLPGILPFPPVINKTPPQTLPPRPLQARRAAVNDAAPLHELVDFYVNDALHSMMNQSFGTAQDEPPPSLMNAGVRLYKQERFISSIFNWNDGVGGFNSLIPGYGEPVWNPQTGFFDLSKYFLQTGRTGATDTANTDAPLHLSWPTDQPLCDQPATASQGAGATDTANTTPANANQPLPGVNTAGVPLVSDVPPYSTERLTSLTPATGYRLQLGGWLDTQPRLVPFSLGGVIDGPPPSSMMLENTVADDVVPVVGDLGVPLDDESAGSSNAVATAVAEPITLTLPLPFYGKFFGTFYGSSFFGFGIHRFPTLSDDDDDDDDDRCDVCGGYHVDVSLADMVEGERVVAAIADSFQRERVLIYGEGVWHLNLPNPLVPSINAMIPGYGGPIWNTETSSYGQSLRNWATGRTDRWSDLPNTGTDTRPGTFAPANSSLPNRDLPGTSYMSNQVQPATGSQDAGPTRRQQLLDGAKPLTTDPTATSPGPTSTTARRQQLLDEVKTQRLTGTSATSSAAPASSATRRQDLLEQTNTSLKSEQTGARSTASSDHTPRTFGRKSALTDGGTRRQMSSSCSRFSNTRHFGNSAGTGGAGPSGRGGNAFLTPSRMRGMAPGIGRTTMPAAGTAREQRGRGMHF